MTAADQVARPGTGGRRRRRRQQRFGITEPGTYSTIPAWWSRERWRSECRADLHTADVAELRRQVGRRGPVSVAACWALASALSSSADTTTGRNAMPGDAALTAHPNSLDVDDPAVLGPLEAATGYGLTTLQKAGRVLAARGWIVLIRSGKNRLTRADRVELRRGGSAADQRRNVWACTIPRHLRAKPAPVDKSVDNSDQQAPTAGAGCDLPTTRRVGGPAPLGPNKIFKREQASGTGAAHRPSAEHSQSRRTYRADPRTVQLAKNLKARVYWLGGISHQRIMPALDRFAKAGWGAADILRELDRTLAHRDWEVPSGRVSTTHSGRKHRYPLRCPWAYLAMLLRTLEPTDLAAERNHALRTRMAQLRYQQLRRTGPECVHGEPAGDVPSPVKGVLACPLCRRDRGALPATTNIRGPDHDNADRVDVSRRSHADSGGSSVKPLIRVDT